jgi:hypothetical protein
MTRERALRSARSFEVCADGALIIYATMADGNSEPIRIRIEPHRVGAVLIACGDALHVMTQDQQLLHEQAELPPIRCSFCVKDRRACKLLISGPRNIYICDECVELCSEICRKSKDDAPGRAEELSALRARVTEHEKHRATEQRTAVLLSKESS